MQYINIQLQHPWDRDESQKKKKKQQMIHNQSSIFNNSPEKQRSVSFYQYLGSTEHQRIFGEPYIVEIRKRATSNQKSSIFQLEDTPSNPCLKIRNSATFESQILYNQHRASVEKVIPGSKKKVQMKPSEQPYIKMKNYLQKEDHSKQYFYPCTNEKENQVQDRLRGNRVLFILLNYLKPSSFIPNYHEQTIQDKRRRDFIDDQVGDTNARVKSQLQETNQSSYNQQQSQILSNTSEILCKQSPIQQSPMTNKSSHKQQFTSPNQKKSPSNVNVNQIEQNKEIVQLNEKFEKYKNDRRLSNLDQPIEISIDLPTPCKSFKRQKSTDLSINSSNPVMREQSQQFNRQRSRKCNENQVDVLQLEISGIDNTFDERLFQKQCRDIGLHMVYCHPEYNKLTNQQNGKGQLLVRNPKQCDVKEQIKNLGYQVQKKQEKNKLTNIVPNGYIQRQQEIQKIQESMSKEIQIGVKQKQHIEQKYERYVNMTKDL